jgi:uncharacterized protein YoxC
MDLNIITLVIAAVAFIIGIVAGKFIFAKDTRKRVEEAELIKQNLNRQIEVVTNKQAELEKHQEEHTRRLEKRFPVLLLKKQKHNWLKV